MASVTDGRYFVYTMVSNSQSCITAPTTSKNGTAAKVESTTLAYNQIVEVSTIADGSRVLTSVSAGKAFTSPGAAGQAVTLYNARGADQKWQITDAGTTATIDGTEYPAYYIEDYDDSSLAMIKLSTDLRTGNNSRGEYYRFYFVPASVFHSGGVYEIRPVSNTGMAVESFHTTINDVNACLGSAAHDNTQKWVFEEVSSWTGLSSGDTAYIVRNANTGKYLTTPTGTISNGTNVLCAAKDTSRVGMLWKVIQQSNAATVDGVACATFKLRAYDTTGGTYYLDTESATLKAFTNIVVATASSSKAQVMALLPTDALDPTMPVPYDLGIADTVGGEGKLATDDVAASNLLIPTWKCAAAQAADGDNHFELRTRTRLMDTATSSWNTWGKWTSWMTPSVYRQGRQAWKATGTPFSFGDGTTWNYKAIEYEFQVRSSGTRSTSLLHSKAADVVTSVYKRVSVDITGTTWTPEGLRLDYSDDYPYGTTYVNFTSLTDGSDEYLTAEHSSETAELTGSAVIPLDKFATWPEEGEELTLAYKVGYDQRVPWYTLTDTVTVSYTGGTVSVTPTFVEIAPRLLAVVPDLGTTRVWVSFDGELYECYKATDYDAGTGYAAFEVLYPMRKGFRVFVSSTNADGSEWGTTMVSHDAMPYVFHAFTWNGGSVYLQRFTGERSVTTSYSPVYEADVLDSRLRESVSYGPTVKVRKSVSGVLLDDDASGVKDLAKLANKHAIYRSPLGGIHEVAVTGVSTTERGNRTEVSVDMVEEA